MFEWPDYPRSTTDAPPPPMRNDSGGDYPQEYYGDYSRFYQRRHVRYAWIIPVVAYFLLAVGLAVLVGALTMPEVGLLVFVGVSIIFLVSLAGMRYIGLRL